MSGTGIFVIHGRESLSFTGDDDDANGDCGPLTILADAAAAVSTQTGRIVHFSDSKTKGVDDVERIWNSVEEEHRVHVPSDSIIVPVSPWAAGRARVSVGANAWRVF